MGVGSALGLTGVTVTGNTAAGDGGGIDTNAGAVITANNSTISGNTASGAGGGIGLYNGSSATLNNTIVSGNLSGPSPDIAKTGATSGTLSSASSLLGTGVVIDVDNGGNISSDTPGLGALADNGGPVQTLALLAGSAAIDAGDAALLPTDAQDVDGDGNTAEDLPIDANGTVRVIGALDIGAVEANATIIVDTLADNDDGDLSAGELSLREALGLVADGGRIIFDPSLSPGSASGGAAGVIQLAGGVQLNISESVTIDGDLDGDGKADIEVNGGDASRVFNVVGTGTTAEFRSLTIAEGDTTGNGGAILGGSGTTVTVVNSTVADNSGYIGGGIFSFGDVNVVNSTIRDNASGLYGGGVASYGAMLLLNATVSGNSTQYYGGGVFGDGGSASINVVNSTIIENTAGLNGTPDLVGGGLSFGGSGLLTVTNSVIAANLSGTTANDVDAPVDVAISSFFGTATTITTNNNSTNGGGLPGVNPLADNGGPVETALPISTSPLLGAGDAALLPSDIFDIDNDGDTGEELPLAANGGARVQGAEGLDIGAAEIAGGPDLTATNFTISKTNVFLGEDVDITFDLSNIGGADSGVFRSDILISADPTLATGLSFLGGLEADLPQGTTAPASGPIGVQGFLAPGTYFVGVVADVFDDVAESNETNNISNVIEVTISGIGPVTIPNAGGPTGGFGTLSGASFFARVGDTINVDGPNYQANPETVSVFANDLTFDLPSGVTPTFILDDDNGLQISFTNSGDVVVQGSEGDDTVNGGDGNDTLFGSEGNDSLSGGGGINTVDYSGSTARVAIDLAADTAEFGHAAGDDLNSIEHIIGSDFNDLIKGDSSANMFDGGEDVDNLIGRTGNDMLIGGLGNDLLNGGGDDDTLLGGADNDQLRGTGGVDSIEGGAGMDTAFGGVGNDFISGGSEDDELSGQGNNDTILGDAGNDVLRGGSGNDSLEGGDDDDELLGQGNNDMLIGGQGNDTLTGAAGSDTLEGGIGNDTLSGGNGADRLDGGAGNDVLNGGGQADRLVFGLGGENDTISGFEDNIDTIEIAAALAGGQTVAQLLADTSITNQVGASVVMDFGGGDVLRINNVGVGDLLDDMLIV